MRERDQVLTVGPLLCGHYRWGSAPIGTVPGRNTPETVYRPGGSDDWHLILTLDGLGAAGTTAPSHPAPPRRALLWRPGVAQCYLVAPGAAGWERLWVHMRPPAAWLPRLAWPEVERGLAAVDLDPTAFRAARLSLTTCHAHAGDASPDRQARALSSLEQAIDAIAQAVRASGRGPPTHDARIERLVAAVAADLPAAWTLPALAAIAGVSVPQLGRLCQRHLGETPHRLVERLRLDEASRRLEHDDAPVADIAHALGFADLSHFSRRFRRRFTVNPTLWRNGRRHGDLAPKPDPEDLPSRRPRRSGPI